MLAAAGAGAALAGRFAGAGGAVRVALRMSLTLALLIVAVNALVVDRGETVLLRLGELPLLGQVNVTAEALAAGATIGLRAAVAMVAFAVYSACVDPDRVLRALRPFARRSALTAALISRLVPVAAADASRLREASRLRGPAAAPLGRAALARRLLTGSLDRAVDVAATLELRGYSLQPPRPARSIAAFSTQGWGRGGNGRSRYDRRFYLTGAVVLAAAIAGKLAGRRRLPCLPDDRARPDAGDARRLGARDRRRLRPAAPARREARCLSSQPRPAPSPPWRSSASPTPIRGRVLH